MIIREEIIIIELTESNRGSQFSTRSKITEGHNS